MQTESVGNKSHLLERYPEIAFLLNYSPQTPCNPPLPEKVQTPDVDLLYVYGVGTGEYYSLLQEWLKERKERRLIFIEDELSAIDYLLHTPHAESLFLNPQVEICFLQGKTIDTPLQEIVDAHPWERIEIVACASYKKRSRRFQQIRLSLLRKSAVAHALLMESLYSHKMLPNLLSNIKRWHGSFFATNLRDKFKNIPALICGAGPSLQASLNALKALEDRALIIAGGSTIAALSNQGIHPHLGIALDPNEEEFERLKMASSFEMPLIYATRLHPDVFNAIHGERGYLISDTGGPCEHYFEKQLQLEGNPIGPELGNEAFSVTTLAVALAVEMGCNPILLNGIDLAYTGMRRYAEGILPSSDVHLEEMRKVYKASDRCLKRKNIQGHYVDTLVKWVMESECIAAYAACHPNHRFINVSSEGIGFPNIPNLPLSEVMEKELTHSIDLRGMVHAQIQRVKMPVLQEQIEEEMKEVAESLKRLKTIAEQMIQELQRVKVLPGGTLPTGKMTILEMDFQEEKAFECLFPRLGPALDRLLAPTFILPSSSSEEEKQRLQIATKLAKWQQWLERIDDEVAVFEAFNP